MAGLLITIEGIEGAGKSTQARLLADAVRARGRAVVLTREPGGGGRVGETLRDLLRNPAIWRDLELSEIFLYAAARAQHLEAVILPALERGEIVVCDRYLDSTRAYQGFGRGRPLDLIERLHQLPPLTLVPHRTLLLDVPAETGLDRARRRTTEAPAGYDEADHAFFVRVRDGFLQIARREPARVRIVRGDRPIAEVHADAVAAIADLVPGILAVETR